MSLKHNVSIDLHDDSFLQIVFNKPSKLEFNLVGALDGRSQLREFVVLLAAPSSYTLTYKSQKEAAKCPKVNYFHSKTELEPSYQQKLTR